MQILNPEYVEVESNGVKTFQQLFNDLFALIDFSKVTANAHMEDIYSAQNSVNVYRLRQIRGTTSISVETLYIGGGLLTLDLIELKSGSQYSRKVEGQAISYQNNVVVPTGSTFRFYYW